MFQIWPEVAFHNVSALNIWARSAHLTAKAAVEDDQFYVLSQCHLSQYFLFAQSAPQSPSPATSPALPFSVHPPDALRLSHLSQSQLTCFYLPSSALKYPSGPFPLIPCQIVNDAYVTAVQPSEPEREPVPDPFVACSWPAPLSCPSWICLFLTVNLWACSWPLPWVNFP